MPDWENTVQVCFTSLSRGESKANSGNQAKVLTRFKVSPGTSHGGTAPEAQATGEHREPLGLRQRRTRRRQAAADRQQCSET